MPAEQHLQLCERQGRRRQLLVAELMRCLLPVRIVGVLPKVNGGAVVAANHISWLDGILLCIFMQQPMLFAVTGEYAHKPAIRMLFGILSWATGSKYLALDPEQPFGMRRICAALGAGEWVMIFPEGGISRDGSLQPLREGIFWVARKAKAPIIPVRLDGLASSAFGRAPGKLKSLRPSVEITVGVPIDPNNSKSEDCCESLRRALSRRAELSFDITSLAHNKDYVKRIVRK